MPLKDFLAAPPDRKPVPESLGPFGWLTVFPAEMRLALTG